MKGECALLRVGEYLVGFACRRLPPEIQDERYREWAAELPAILHDREIRPAPYRAVRMLGYAADTLRGTGLMPGRGRPRLAGTASPLWPGLLVVAGSVAMVWDVRDTVRAPGHWVNYVQLAWSLSLVAWPISQYVGPTVRMTGLIVIGGGLAGLVVCIWTAVQAPGDWVNYVSVFLLLVLVLVWYLVRRWVRTGQA